MTLAEIRARKSEISNRLEAIKADTLSERSKEELDGIAIEVESLKEEYRNMVKEETNIMATVEDYAPVIESGAVADEGMARRKAFQSFVATGKADPILRATVTGDVTSVVIPQEITSQLFKVDAHFGSIYARVTKTNYAAGVNIPIGNFSPEVEWLEERGSASDSNATTDYIAFTVHKAQVKVPISLEVSVMALPEFESMIVNKIQEAFMKEFDSVIIAGDGATKPEGITVSTKGATYTMADATDYTEWIKSYSQVPISAQNGVVLVINKEDWYGTILSIKDSNGNPLAVWSMGFGGNMVPTFMGKEVILVENQGLNKIADGGVCAFWMNLADYTLNFNKTLQMKTYTDESTDDLVYKATCLVDGKVVSGDSLVKITL